jgi:hypothetical protein
MEADGDPALAEARPERSRQGAAIGRCEDFQQSRSDPLIHGCSER